MYANMPTQKDKQQLHTSINRLAGFAEAGRDGLEGGVSLRQRICCSMHVGSLQFVSNLLSLCVVCGLCLSYVPVYAYMSADILSIYSIYNMCV
jgi:hypothetical protein